MRETRKITVICVIVALTALSAAAEAREMPLEARAAPPRGQAGGLFQRQALERLAAGRFAPVDTLRLLAIRVSFADMDFSVPPHDSLYFANELRHVREYFKGASIGAFGFGWEIAPGVTELGFEAAYYGERGMWTKRVAEIMIEVVARNDTAIDFSRFNAFALIHPGAGRETDFLDDSPWQMWSGFVDPLELAAVLADTLGTPGVPTDDTLNGEIFYIDNVMVLPETASQDGITFGSLGIYCYQVGMRLGMLPLWDTTPSGFTDSQGIGAFGLMGYGLYNASGFVPAFPCAFHRYLMGWVEPILVSGGGRVRLPDVSGASGEGPALARIDLSPSEYLLIENRLHDFNRDGRFDFGDVSGDGVPANIDTLLGAEFDFFLTATTNPYRYEEIDGRQVRITDTGCGIMIWHIDEAIISSRLAAGGYPNDEARLSGVDLEEADGLQDLDRRGGQHAFGSWGDSYRDGWYTRFGPDTDPSSDTNTGRRTGLTIEVVSAPGPVMFFDVFFDHVPDRIAAQVAGDVTGLSPIVVDLGDSRGSMIVQAADTGRLHVGWGIDRDDWDGALTQILQVPGAVWSGPPVVAALGGAEAILIASRDGRIHACRPDGEPVPLDYGTAPGSLEVAGTIVSAPMALGAGGDDDQEILFLVSDGDTVWCYFLGRSIPIEGGFSVGSGVHGVVLAPGSLVSHPVAGNGPDGIGFYALTADGDQAVRLHYVRTTPTSESIEVETWSVPGSRAAARLVTPCAGDIDGNGSDEFVAALPGCGLFYFSRARGMHFAPLAFETPSPPALADIDGDGVLETLIRDRGALYLLTGFGTPVRGWPQTPVSGLQLFETSHAAAQPTAADLNGDGRLEALFNVAGDLWAFDGSGRPVAGWPFGGEADHTVSVAVARGEGERQLIFIAGAPERILSPGQSGTSFSSQRSGLSRLGTGAPWSPEGWLMYRRDARGSGRQTRSAAAPHAGPAIDEASFICYPNPARGGSFRARIDLSTTAEVTLRLINLEGVEVHTAVLRHEWQEGRVPFEAVVPVDGLAAGVYLCHLNIVAEGLNWSGARKVAVLK